MRRPWLVSTLATVTALAVVEAAFRIAGIPDYRPEDRITELDPYRIVRNRAGLSMRVPPWNVTVTTNRLGFRGPRVAEEKPAGSYRVVVVGDSSTFGVGVGDGETFCALAEGILNGGPGGRRFEVVNAGVFGYGTMQGLRTIERAVPALKPDCVVASFAVNDATPGGSLRNFIGRRRPGAETVSPGLVAVRNLLWNRSSFCRWVLRDALEPLWMSRLLRLRAGAEKEGWKPGSPGDYRANLDDIVKTVRGAGAAVVFLPIPVRLKHTPHPLYEMNYIVINRRTALGALRYMKGVIKGAQTRDEESAMWFALARLKEGMRDQRGALEAYLTAASLCDPATDFRWGAYTLSNEMAAVAMERDVPLVNVLIEFYRRELSDNPPDLYFDPYHPGKLGHGIIAGALAATIRDLAGR